jgi:DNA-binding transcriptional ArsR family regulator
MSRPAPEGSVQQRRQHAAVFAALGDETRLALVNTLADGEARCIAQLTGGSRLTRQAITKHLKVLEEAGIVHSARAGRQSLYALDPAPMSDLRGYLERIATQWDVVLGRLRAFVED